MSVSEKKVHTSGHLRQCPQQSALIDVKHHPQDLFDVTGSVSSFFCFVCHILQAASSCSSCSSSAAAAATAYEIAH